MHPKLAQFLIPRYPIVKASHPTEGRRRVKLQVIDEFWASGDVQSGLSESSEAIPDSTLEDRADPYDVDPIPGGIVVRTDFSNDEAWSRFVTLINEQEEAGMMEDEEDEEEEDEEGEAEGEDDGAEEDGDAEMEVDEDNEAQASTSTSSPVPRLLAILDPSGPDRAVFNNASNLTVLRLVNEVDIRPSPPLLPDRKTRIKPGHRLVDLHGWQEIYTGPTPWVYDARSNQDQTVRAVSQESDFYGTATGDSWRTQGSRIWDLQRSITFEGLKISFGGMDRWDYSERKRNLDEANISIV